MRGDKKTPSWSIELQKWFGRDLRLFFRFHPWPIQRHQHKGVNLERRRRQWQRGRKRIRKCVKRAAIGIQFFSLTSKTRCSMHDKIQITLVHYSSIALDYRNEKKNLRNRTITIRCFVSKFSSLVIRFFSKVWREKKMCIRLIYAVIPSLTTTPTDERIRRHGKSESPIYQGCFPSFPFSRYFLLFFSSSRKWCQVKKDQRTSVLCHCTHSLVEKKRKREKSRFWFSRHWHERKRSYCTQTEPGIASCGNISLLPMKTFMDWEFWWFSLLRQLCGPPTESVSSDGGGNCYAPCKGFLFSTPFYMASKNNWKMKNIRVQVFFPEK